MKSMQTFQAVAGVGLGSRIRKNPISPPNTMITYSYLGNFTKTWKSYYVVRCNQAANGHHGVHRTIKKCIDYALSCPSEHFK